MTGVLFSFAINWGSYIYLMFAVSYSGLFGNRWPGVWKNRIFWLSMIPLRFWYFQPWFIMYALLDKIKEQMQDLVFEEQMIDLNQLVAETLRMISPYFGMKNINICFNSQTRNPELVIINL